MLHFPGGTVLPPHNLLLLAAMLKEQGEVIFLDAVAEDYSEIKIIEQIKLRNPDAVFINTSTPTIEIDCLLAAKLKKDLDLKVILLGPHAVATAEEVFAKTAADAILIDISPEVIDKLIQLTKSGQFKAIPGICILSGQEVIKQQCPHGDMDNFPFPAWDIAPYNKYFYLYKKEYPYVTMHSSRGCVFRCKFCPYPVAQQFRYSRMSALRVVREMEFLKKEVGAKMVLFRDALFAADYKRTAEICRLIKDRGLSLKWRCETSLDSVDKELLLAMKEAGCLGINFGVESVSGDVASDMDCEAKRKSLEKTKEVFKTCRELGIETFAFFINGLPNDSAETIKENVSFAIELEPDHVQFTFATPFPGTELFVIAKKENLLIKKDWKFFSSLEPVMATRWLSLDQVFSINRQAYSRFFLRPKRIIKEILFPGRLIRRILTYLNWKQR